MRTRKTGFTLGVVASSAVLSCATFSVATAGPQGGVITKGQGSISTPDASTTVINQSSNVLNVDWQSFNVGASERVSFEQPTSTAVAVNRILDASASEIFGRIDANGRVVLINPNGILFGRTAQLNVGSLVASSLNLINYDEVNGRLSFAAGETAGAVINEGTISGSSIALLGGRVTNDGLIVANYGSVALGAGNAATLDFFGDGLLQMQIDAPGAGAQVTNTGSVLADGGTVLLTAQAAESVLANVVNNEGIVRANRIENVGGTIRLAGPDGIVTNSGTLDASGVGGTGGSVDVFGERVALLGNSVIDASGDAGGGTVRVGGDFQGKNPDVLNAERTLVGGDAVIRADAGASGDGGRVIVWADDLTVFHGHISATSQNGNGGFAEVSGKQSLGFNGTVDLSASNGASGTLLLDPDVINISLENDDDGELPDIGAGDDPGATYAISVNGLITALGTSDVNLAAASEINVEAAVGAGATTNDLSLTAPDITFNAGVTLGANAVLTLDSSSAITGTGTLTAGTINLNGSGSVGSSGSRLNTNVDSINFNKGGGATFLENAGALELSGSSTGNVDVTAGGEITQSGPLTFGGTTTLAAGAANNITLNDAGNNFSTVSITSGNNVTLVDANALNLGASTISGTLNVTAGGDIGNTGGPVSVSGDASFTANGTAASITLQAVGNTFQGAVSFLGADLANVSVRDTTALELHALDLSGNLTVDAAGITQSGALVVGGTATFNSLGQDIDLDDIGNNFNKVSLTGANVRLWDLGTLDFENSNISGNLAVQANTIIDTGTLTVAGTSHVAAPGGSITLDSAANDFQEVELTGETVLIVDQSDIVLGPSSLSGSLSVTAGGTVTQSVALAVSDSTTINAGGDVILDNPGNAISGIATPIGVSGNNVTLVNAFDVNLAASNVAGNLEVTANTGWITSSGPLNVTGSSVFTANEAGASIVLTDPGNTFNGPVTFVGPSLANVQVVDTTALDLQALTVTGDLWVTAAGITQSGSLSAATVFLDSGAADIVLDDTGNDFGTVNATGGNVTLADANDLDLGDVTANALSVTAAGTVSDSSIITVSGLTTLSANSVELDVLFSDFGTISLNATSASVLDFDDVDLGTSTVGTLTVESFSGSITNNGGALSVTGPASFTANGGGASIILDNAGNTFGGTVALDGISLGDVSITDTTALDLQALTLFGDLTVTAPTLTQSGDLFVAGTTTLNLGASGTAVLASAGNDFEGAFNVTNGGTVTVVDSNELLLGDITLSGNLAATASGDITGNGALVIGGNATFTANGGGQSITLANAANDFSGDVTFAGAGGLDSVTVTDSSALTLHALNLTGNLTVSAAGVDSDGALVINGATSIDGQGGDVVLTNAGNDFGSISATGSNISLVDSTDVVLNGVTAPGSLNVTAGGDVTQIGAVTAGAAAFDLAGNNLTLTNGANDFGLVTVNAATNVSLQDANALTVGAIDAAGSVDLQAGSILDDLDPGSTTRITGTDITLVSAGAIGSSATNGEIDTDSGQLSITAGGDVFLRNDGSFGLSGFASGGPAGRTISLFADDGTITLNGQLATLSDAVLTLGNLDPNNDVDYSGETLGVGSNAITVLSGRNLTVGSVLGSDITLRAGAAGSSTSGNLTMGTVTGSGSITVSALGSVTSTGVVSGPALTASGASITLDTLVGEFTGTSAGSIVVDNGNGGLLLNDVQAGSLQVSANSMAQNAGTAVTVTGNTTLTAANNGSIIVGNAGNSFGGSVSLQASSGTLANVTITDSTALDLQALTLSGNLTATGAGITDAGALIVAGNTTLNAGTGNVVLDNANNFASVAVTSANNVTITDINAVQIGASNISGNLTLNTAGNITGTGSLVVAGTTTVSPGAGSNVSLDVAGTNFGGAVSVTGAGAVSLRDANAITLGNITAESLGVNAGGNITGSGALVIAGDSSFQTTAAGSSILLTNAGNNFTGAVNLVGAGLNSVSVTDTSALDLGALTLSSNLTLNAAGITDSGAWVVGGATNLSAGTGDIVLDDPGGDFGTVTVGSANNVSIADASNLTAGNINATGDVVLDVAGQLLDDNDNATRIGGSTLTISASGVGTASSAVDTAVSTLDVSAVGGSVNLSELDAVTLTGIRADDVTLTAGGAITDGTIVSILADVGTITGASIGTSTNRLDVDVGTLTLNSTGGAIFVNNARTTTLSGTAVGGVFDFTNSTGAITVGSVSGNGVNLTSAGALNLGTVSGGGGAMNLTAAGAITDAGTGAAISGGDLTISGTAIGTEDNPIDTAIGSVVATATAGGIFLADANDLTVTSASATGPVELYAGSATTLGSLTVGDITSPESVLLVASRNINAIGGTLIETPVAELRAGVIEGGQVGSAAQPVSFGTPLTEVTLFLPTSPGQAGVPAIPPLMNGPPGVTPQVFTFVGSGNDALFARGVGAVPTENLLGSTQGFINVEGLDLGSRAAGGSEQLLIIDWASFDPNISLFGTLSPAIRLPPDQLEDEDEAAFNFGSDPDEYTIVHARDGWKIVRAFRRVSLLTP